MSIFLKYYRVLITVFFLSSCATLTHQPTVGVKVYSETDSVEICINNDTANWLKTPVWVNVERSKNDLQITARKDTVQKQINVRSKISTAFWLGNMFSGVGVIGYFIDLTNSKMFTYPRNITINLVSNNYRTWLTPHNGSLALKISIPEANCFYLNKGYGYGGTFGYLGISGGIEYYFSDKYSVNMDIGTLTDFAIPIPAPVDYEGSYERSFATYGDLQLGSDYKRFHYDTGIQYTKTSFYQRETVQLFPEYIDTLKYSMIQNNIGLSVSTYYRISNSFNVGMNYYPSFVVWNDFGVKVHYTHILFFELTFKIEG